ncbi:MAG: folylpolyglutamate synthase/dihydrofolate synthase family protein [Acidobacteriota bacterium]|nr:folylpolyglutamate synthase/dihydrofolate synthase family protein [Acidobacteriota bacterium]
MNDRGSARRRPEEILAELEVFGVKLGLETTTDLLAALGQPQGAYPVILVGGTNGKGSTATVLSEILRAAGRRVGLYTSPHLEVVEERIRVDGSCLTEDTLSSYLEWVIERADVVLGHPPTYFESLTVAAYAYFRDRAVDVAVMEVGLGGRLDATNAADPILSIVTSISRDHTQVLGEGLDQIAREKAGIFRTGRPALCWLEPALAAAALIDEAERRGSRLVDAGHGVSWSDEARGLSERRSARLETARSEYRIETSLVGAYQMRNLSIAVRAAEILSDAGFEIGVEAIEAGIRASWWPGRCEVVELPGGGRFLLDAAHNEDGIRWLGRQLDASCGKERWQVIFGTLDDKPAESMLGEILPHAERLILTAPDSPRATSPETLLPLHGADRFLFASTCAEALDLALGVPAPRVVACGSIYLVGEVRAELRRRFGVPAPTTIGSPGH